MTLAFLFFAWHWRPDNTPVDYRGQAVWIKACLSGPGVDALAGCVGRFDENGDKRVTLYDWHLFLKRIN